MGNYWIKSSDMRGIKRLQVSSAAEAESLISAFRALPNVLWASSNVPDDKYLLTIPDDRFYRNPPQFIRQFHGFFQTSTANDNLHPLWHLGDPTHARLSPDAHIYAYKAWNEFNYHGSATHTILICDNPMEKHNDFMERFDGKNRNFQNEVQPSLRPHFHGMNVAGLAAASGNNGKGVVGIDWNVQIQHGGLVPTTMFASLITQNEQMNPPKPTRVSNHSYGTYVMIQDQIREFAYAYNLDHLTVVAAGNYFGGLPPQTGNPAPQQSPHVNPIFYPSAYYGVLCVGGTDETDHRYYTKTAPASRYLNAVSGTAYPNYSPSYILEELNGSLADGTPSALGSPTGFYIDIVAPSVRMLTTTVKREKQACTDGSAVRYDEIFDEGDPYRVVAYGSRP
jgi:hypothetical protein